MKALSIRQPWAWLICAGHKDIENRDWATNIRGRIYIHAGQRPDGSNYNETKHITAHAGQILAKQLNAKREDWCAGPLFNLWALIYTRDDTPWSQFYGAIIGEVDIVNCLEYWSGPRSKSPWFVGKYGFVLANPVLYEKPIPYKGRLGFFEVEIPDNTQCTATATHPGAATPCSG